MKAPCEMCFKKRPLRRIVGGKLGPKGKEICRTCYGALKEAAK